MPFGTDDWWSLARACGVLALWSTLVVLPCTWAMLIARDPWAGTGIVLVYQFLLTLIVVPVVSVLAGGGINADYIGMGMFLLLLLQAGCVGALLGSLAVVRRAGYYWHRPGTLPASAPLARRLLSGEARRDPQTDDDEPKDADDADDAADEEAFDADPPA